MGSAGLWWRPLSSARSAQECQVPPRRKQSFCCSLGEWIPCFLGRCPFWWWQLRGGTSASQRAAGTPCGRSFCCRPSRWIRRHLGVSRFRLWQRVVAAWDTSPGGQTTCWLSEFPLFVLIWDMFRISWDDGPQTAALFCSGNLQVIGEEKKTALQQRGLSMERAAFDSLFAMGIHQWIRASEV